MSLLHSAWSFPPAPRVPQPSETHTQNLGLKLKWEEAGVAILAVVMGHSTWRGDHSCPFPAPRCTKYAPLCFSG